MAIVEGRERVGRGNVGVAVVDLHRAACKLYQVPSCARARQSAIMRPQRPLAVPS
jgi:hypothetical protein